MSTDTKRIGRYELYERIGRSGTFEVWRAYDPQQHRRVIMKWLLTKTGSDPDYIMHFTREANAIASLNHPNIITLHDAHILSARRNNSALIYLVTDDVEGTTLADYIRSNTRSGKLPTDIVPIFACMAAAIDYAHQGGIFHGSLKPTSIILQQSTIPSIPGIEPLVSDLGMTRLTKVISGAQPRRTMEEMTYISPEQARGSLGDERSDIYSLGVMLYELCTGVVPFQGTRPVALLMQHSSVIPTSPELINPNVPLALSSVIMRSLAKNPDERFDSATSLSIELARALNTPLPNTLDHPQVISSENQGKGRRPYIVDALPQRITVPVPTPELAATQKRKGSSSDTATVAAKGARKFRRSTGVLLRRNTGVLGVRSRFRTRRKRERQLVVTIAASLLLLAILFVVIAEGYALSRRPSVQPVPPTPIAQPAQPVSTVGHAFFSNSEQLDENMSSQGVNDQLQMSLSSIPAPAPGASYYAWLLPDKTNTTGTPLLLGSLQVTGGAVHFLYMGQSQHSNLLAQYSRLLITAQDSGTIPTAPSPDTHRWRYYGELPQAVSQGNFSMLPGHFSMLDHLRHMLVDTPELTELGLHGGLAIWLLQNTERVSALSANARDAWQTKAFKTVRQQMAGIVEYLDGKNQAANDLPAHTPYLVDAPGTQISLLGRVKPNDKKQANEAPGYIYLLGAHLSAAVQSPGATQEQRQSGAQINGALHDMASELNQVHLDAENLARMSDSKLGQSSTLSTLDEMVTLSQDAYVGHLDQSSGQAQGGAIWVYAHVQHLADFAMKPYQAPR